MRLVRFVRLVYVRCGSGLHGLPVYGSVRSFIFVTLVWFIVVVALLFVCCLVVAWFVVCFVSLHYLTLWT